MRNIRLSFFQPLQYLEFLLVPVLIRATMIAEEMTANAINKGDRISCEKKFLL